MKDKPLRDSELEPVLEHSEEGTFMSSSQKGHNKSRKKRATLTDQPKDLLDERQSQSIEYAKPANDSGEMINTPQAQIRDSNDVMLRETFKTNTSSRYARSQLIVETNPDSFQGSIRFTFSLMFSPRMRWLLPQIFWTGISIAYWSGLAATIIVRTIPDKSDSD